MLGLGSALKELTRRILGLSRVDKQAVEEIIRDLQRALLQADVKVDLVFQISNRIREKALKEEPYLEPRQHVLRIIYHELVNLLGQPLQIQLRSQRILVMGLYGSGKTTSVGKLAKYFRDRGLRVGVICTDTHRKASYAQLKQLCDAIHVDCFGDESCDDPIKILRAGLEKFQDGRLIIIDSAGRDGLNPELIAELKSIAQQASPDLKLLVIDAAHGQSAADQALGFHAGVGVDGVIISKMDGTAKAGGALSAVAATQAKIAFIGTGEHLDEFEPFDPSGFISRLLGMGDLKALVERAERVIAAEKLDQQELERRILSGKFSLRDLYSYLDMIRKLGPLRKIFSMIPVIGIQLDEDSIQQAIAKLDSFRVIMDSMTKQELENPRLVDSSRIRRIARGSGKSLEEVKQLLEYHRAMERMIKQFSGRGMRKLMRMFKGLEPV